MSKFGDLVRFIDLGHFFALAVYKLLLKHVTIMSLKNIYNFSLMKDFIRETGAISHPVFHQSPTLFFYIGPLCWVLS